MSYKNVHMAQYVSVPKILKALSILKELGHPYYQFIPQNVNFDDECRENDIEGFNFLYPEDEIMNEVDVSINAEFKNVHIIESDDEDIESVEKQEQEYRDKDPVKKSRTEDTTRSAYFSLLAIYF